MLNQHQTKMNDKVSVVIPTRGGQPYLQLTIDDLLKKAEGEIEVIVVLDGLWPEPAIRDDKRVRVIHHGELHDNPGMKASISKGIAAATGKYILKTDAHCMFGQGYDRILKADCEENWVVIPRRYRLMADEEPWRLEEYLIQYSGEIIPDPTFHSHRPPVDYMYLAYPYERPYDKTCGLHGSEWRERHYERLDAPIDDTMSWQGSAYFMHKKHWETVIEDFDIERFGNFTMEAQEIGNKTWLSGGRLVINKKTWYAHMHKGKRGKQYHFTNGQYERFGKQNEMGRLAGIEYFIYDHWPKRLHNFEWLLEKFWPVPTWPENWHEQLVIDEKKDYSHVEGYQGI